LVENIQNTCLKLPRNNMMRRGEFFASGKTVTLPSRRDWVLETVFQQRPAGPPIPA
jgi:hypothetical protein